MTFLASIHLCVNAAIRVGGLPVNYTSAEHDRRSTQENSLLEEAIMEKNRTNDHEVLKHCLINLHQCWQHFSSENDKHFLLLILCSERFQANDHILPKPSSTQCVISKTNASIFHIVIYKTQAFFLIPFSPAIFIVFYKIINLASMYINFYHYTKFIWYLRKVG